MRRGRIWVALLFSVMTPGQRAVVATPADPFVIERTGTERRAAVASLPVVFRIESDADRDNPDDSDEGAGCSRWRVLLLMRAWPD